MNVLTASLAAVALSAGAASGYFLRGIEVASLRDDLQACSTETAERGERLKQMHAQLDRVQAESEARRQRITEAARAASDRRQHPTEIVKEVERHVPTTDDDCAAARGMLDMYRDGLRSRAHGNGADRDPDAAVPDHPPGVRGASLRSPAAGNVDAGTHPGPDS